MTAPVYATFTAAPPMVRAAQLTEETADRIIAWTNGQHAPSGRVWLRPGVVARPGDWVIQGKGGMFSVLRPDDFAELYTAAGGGDR